VSPGQNDAATIDFNRGFAGLGVGGHAGSLD